MSQRGDRGEGHARRPSRSSFGGHRGGGVGGAGKGGGPPSGQPPLSTNRSFKKPGNGHGGHQRVVSQPDTTGFQPAPAPGPLQTPARPPPVPQNAATVPAPRPQHHDPQVPSWSPATENPASTQLPKSTHAVMETVALCEASMGKVDDRRNGEAEGTSKSKTGRTLEGNGLRLAGKAQAKETVAKNGVAEGRSKSLLLHREVRSKKMMIEKMMIGKAKRKVEQEAEAAAKAEKEKQEAKADEETMESDHEAYAASQFRHTWIAVWSRHHGSFDDITKFRPMRFTFERPPDFTFPTSTLQIFSVKVASIRRRRGLQWPLDVFGIVAVRDSVDFNRNIIFSRTRNNCQTLTKEDPYLVLAGPTRAVVWEDFLYIEVKLTVKGRTESEDKDLSFLAVPFACTTVSSYSYRIERYKTSKRSTLRLSLGYIVRSVEATVFMKITKGSWPDCLHGQFDAFTTGVRKESVAAGIDHEKIILLDSRAEKMLVNGDGEIVLSRHVVSVETTGKLKIHVKAFKGSESGENAVEDELVVTPKEVR